MALCVKEKGGAICGSSGLSRTGKACEGWQAWDVDVLRMSSHLIDGEVEMERMEAALYPKADSHHNLGSHSDKALTPLVVDPVAENPQFLRTAFSRPALPGLGMTIRPCRASGESDIGPVWFPTGLRKAYALLGPNTMKLNQTKVP